MSYKWLGGLIGLCFGGPLAALLGYIVGREIDSGNAAIHNKSESEVEPQYAFRFALLVMMAYIIRADKKVMHSEMQLIRKFLRDNFGEQAMLEGEDVLRKLFEKQKEDERIGADEYKKMVRDCGIQLQQIFTYEQRLQLLNFLAEVCKVDNEIHPLEVEALRFIASSLAIESKQVEALLSLGKDTLEDAYKVLQVSPNATDKEVINAYKRLVLQHHPDRVAALGEDVRKAAEKKLCEINNARDIIYKARNI